jgi:hypothetical protein
MEFLGFRGTVGGVPIGVCSTGIGGPYASIALEELANVGVDTFIRVGSAAGGIRLPNPMTRPVRRARAEFESPGTPAPHLTMRAD